MAVKEFRQGFRTRHFLTVFMAIHFFVTGAVVIEFVTGMTGRLPAGAENIWPLALFMPSPFWIVCEVMFLGILPLGGFAALQTEIRGSNIELVLLTKLSRWRIVLGKWFLLTAQSWLVFTSLVPYIVVRYFFGGIDVLQSLYLAICLMGLNALLNAVMVGASAYEKLALRLWMIAYQLGSAALCIGIAVGSGIAIVGAVTSWALGMEQLATWVISFSAFVVAVLYVLFGLQLGRGRIKLFERAFDTPESGVVSVLLFTAPLFIGMVALVTLGFGVIPVTVALCWAVWKLDSVADTKSYVPGDPSISCAPNPPPVAAEN